MMTLSDSGKTRKCQVSSKGRKSEVLSTQKRERLILPHIYVLVSLNYHPNISLEALLLALQEQKMMKKIGLTLWVFHCLTQVRDSSSQGCKGKLMGPPRVLLESMIQSHDTGSELAQLIR